MMRRSDCLRIVLSMALILSLARSFSVRPLQATVRPSLSALFTATAEAATATTEPEKKKRVKTQRVISGVQPTGTLHLGNYLGAIRQWVDFQNNPPTEDEEGNEIKTENLYFVVDLHAITLPHDPKELQESTKKSVALYLAAGKA
mmetsp:Transcript_3320/g.5628  ORF Transcript_3320/g.5628 Transcript_3320/m.5628 type:complete len:145 (-) Transcript_3320:963-1397(-)